MEPTPPNAPLTPPDPYVERSLGHWLYASRSDLPQRLLDELVVHPGSRYRDLKPLLAGRRDQVLTDALRKLQEEGLVVQRGFGPNLRTYQLTTLGVGVRDVVVELRAADRNAIAARGTDTDTASAS